MGTWISNNWFILLQSGGIIGSLLFTGISLRIDSKVRRVSNLMTLTQEHREIWSLLYEQPHLSRGLDAKADPLREAVTDEQKMFVSFLVLHLGSAYHAIKDSMFVPPEGLEKDIQTFFSLPIPKAIWRDTKSFQNKDFVKFVDDCLSRDGRAK